MAIPSIVDRVKGLLECEATASAAAGAAAAASTTSTTSANTGVDFVVIKIAGLHARAKITKQIRESVKGIEFVVQGPNFENRIKTMSDVKFVVLMNTTTPAFEYAMAIAANRMGKTGCVLEVPGSISRASASEFDFQTYRSYRDYDLVPNREKLSDVAVEGVHEKLGFAICGTKSATKTG